MLNIDKYVEFLQKEVKTYLFTLTAEELLNETTVMYYRDDEQIGYQRQLAETHYKKIANYIINDTQSMLPTSIIGAINPTDIIHEGSIIKIINPIRIVDGQHRRAAIEHIKKYQSKEYGKTINKMMFPMLLMEINIDDLNEYIVEVQTFVNINKKGRKVSTDLALSLESNIVEKIIDTMGFGNKSQAVMYISNSIIRELNEDKESCWYKGIKVGDGGDAGRPISKNAFMNSIESFIFNYLSYANSENDFVRDRMIDISSDISYIIRGVWNEIAELWPDCFYWNEQGNISEFDKDYSIQKGIGVYPIHMILEEVDLGSKEQIVARFTEIIRQGAVIDEDWIRGGLFSGFNSASGFKIIKKAILDKESYQRLKFEQ